MIKKVFVSFILLLIGVFQVHAQSKKGFSEDPVVFGTEIKTFFANDKRPESKEALDAFMKLWETGSFRTEEQTVVMEMANNMLAQRFRTYPEFVSYFNLLIAYLNTVQNEDVFTQYHAVAQKLLEKNKRDFTNYTDNISSLFNNSAVQMNAAKKWSVNTKDFTLAYESEPTIFFPSVDMVLYTKEDTLGIFRTRGTYYPLTNKWVGKEGKVYWTRVGFDHKEVFAELKNYSIDLKDSRYTADSVSFTNTKIFATPVLGKLEDKATTNYLGDKASYPRFSSYKNVLELKNVFKNVDYQGGFAMEGAQIYGTGTDENRASVTIKYNGKIMLRALSKSFVIAPDKLVASKASVSFYMEKDSLYHSQLIFNYQDKSRLLSLSRSREGLYASPFYDSYHQMEIQVGNILWNLDSSNVDFRTISNPNQEAIFESADYFNEWKYLQVQGVLDYNPLDKIKRYVDTYKQISISIGDLAAFFNSKPEFINNLLFMLANEGYIFYDFEGQRVIVKNKLLHYVLAYKKVADYDNMHFNSVISARPNATLDLNSYNLKVEGVQKVALSDSQATYIVPKDQVLRIQKNRNLKFDGIMHSGRFDFFGKDFLFNYDSFKVVLNNVDSAKFRFPEYDNNGRIVQMHSIKNSLQNVSGNVYIDKPDNKSGLKPLEEYPIFECNKESFVYYDYKSIYNGIYKRDKFFFTVNPFVIKNLDKFTAEGLQFPGTFHSAGILPVFSYALSIQEDFTLGFKRPSPEGGFKLYKDKGKGSGIFTLNGSGLTQDGEVKYLASTNTSKNFVYFPDSMNSVQSSFELKETEKYPPAIGPDVIQHWSPYNDSLYVYKGKQPVSVYNGKINFSGGLILTPSELVGDGSMVYQTLNFNSNAFAFFPTNIQSKSGDISVKAPGSKRDALQAFDVKMDLDLNKDFGKFEANSDTSKVSLPDNKFSTTLNVFTLDLKANNIDFKKNKNTASEDAYFVSNNPDQQALKFQSEKAQLDLNKQNIKAEDVPFIVVADSKIFTPNKELVIERNGNIASVKGGIIVSSKDNEYHKIYDAFVNILSSSKFAGYGTYDYEDKSGNKFKLKMDDIHTNEVGNTIAKSNVSDTAKFYLSPGIQFKGAFVLYSTRLTPELDGFIFPVTNQPELRTEWIKFADSINAKNIVLNLESAKNKSGVELVTGTYISNDSSKIYNLLFGKKKNVNDLEIFSAKGRLMYDAANNSYRVGPESRVLETDDAEISNDGGNLFVYRNETDEVYTEGLYNLNANLKHISLLAGGSFTYNYKRHQNVFDMAMLVNFPMNDDAFKLMSDSMVDNSFSATQSDLTSRSLANAFALMVKDKKDRLKLVNELVINAYVLNVEEVNKIFVFSSVKMNYNDTLKSFISFGDLGLANMRKTVLNKNLDGIMQIQLNKGKGGDKFALMIESEYGSYHFFSYSNNTLSYLSSDDNFNMKVAETASKTEKGQSGLKIKQAVMTDLANLYALKDLMPNGNK